MIAATTLQAVDIAKASEMLGHVIGKNLWKGPIEAVMNSMEKDDPMVSYNEAELEKADAFGNGDQIRDYENHPLSATDSSKYW